MKNAYWVFADQIAFRFDLSITIFMSISLVCKQVLPVKANECFADSDVTAATTLRG